MCRTTSSYRLLRSGPTFFSFEDVSGWYGSKTGADDLWVLPKPEDPHATMPAVLPAAPSTPAAALEPVFAVRHALSQSDRPVA